MTINFSTDNFTCIKSNTSSNVAYNKTDLAYPVNARDRYM